MNSMDICIPYWLHFILDPLHNGTVAPETQRLQREISDKEFFKAKNNLEEQCGWVKDRFNKPLISEGVDADWFKRRRESW